MGVSRGIALGVFRLLRCWFLLIVLLPRGPGEEGEKEDKCVLNKERDNLTMFKGILL